MQLSRKVAPLLRMATLAALGLAASASRAATLASNTSGTFTSGSNYFGQSFTTPGGLPATNITFNFYSDIPATTPAAFGTGYLFTAPYAGTPAALSGASPGLLGQAAAAGGVYTFGPSVVLLPSTQYFFYESGLVPTGGISGGGTVSGGTDSFTPSDVSPYVGGPLSTNFLVTGRLSLTATPEPSSVAAFGITSLFAAGLMLKAKKRKASETPVV